jgi:hypothetical protein
LFVEVLIKIEEKSQLMKAPNNKAKEKLRKQRLSLIQTRSISKSKDLSLTSGSVLILQITIPAKPSHSKLSNSR